MRVRVFDDGGRRIAAGKDRGLRTELVRALHRLQNAFALGRRQSLKLRRLDVNRGPFDTDSIGEPRCAPHHVLAPRIRTDAAQHRRFGLPDALDRLRGSVGLNVFFDAIGGAAERELAQRH